MLSVQEFPLAALWLSVVAPQHKPYGIEYSHTSTVFAKWLFGHVAQNSSSHTATA